MIRVRTGSRIHFGLLSLQVESSRSFGGAGLMVEEPGVSLTVRPASAWSVAGPCANRAQRVGQAFANAYCAGKLPPLSIQIEQCPSEHAGLGTGTQLGLALGVALARALGVGANLLQLAQSVGRGERSAIGIHGFAEGGFIVDGGKSASTEVAPLLLRRPFPDDWRVLLITPKLPSGAHGAKEREAFAQLTAADKKLTSQLCELLVLGILPALAETDFSAFGEAIFEYNRKSGELFSAWQGGIYSNPHTTILVDLLRNLGIHGVGQSSWGPTVFAIGDEERLRHASQRLCAEMGLTPAELRPTRGRNMSAAVNFIPP